MKERHEILFPLLGKRIKGWIDLKIGLASSLSLHSSSRHGEAQILKAGFKGHGVEQGKGCLDFSNRNWHSCHPGPSRTLGSSLCPYLWVSPWNALPLAHPAGPSGRPPPRRHGARTSYGSQGHGVEGSTPAHRGSRSCTPALQWQWHPMVSGANYFQNMAVQP